MAGLVAHLQRAWTGWNHRSVATLRDMDSDAARFRAALDAEVAVSEMAETFGYHTGAVHLRRRVYIESDGRCREIDVIIVSEVVLVVEVKHWTGDVWMSGGIFYQRPPVRNATSITHPDALEEVMHKANGLQRYLQRQHGIELPDAAVRPVLVFTNRNVRLDPAMLQRHDGIIMTLETFKSKVLQPRSRVWDSVQYWVPVLSGWSGSLSTTVQSKINEALAKTRTWDTVTLHNGQLFTGDIHRVSLSEGTVFRDDIAAFRVTWTSQTALGWVATMWQGCAGYVEVEVLPPRGARRVGVDSKTAPPLPRRTLREVLTPASLSATHGGAPAVVAGSHLVIQQPGQAAATPIALSHIARLEFKSHLISADEQVRPQMHRRAS